MPDIDPLFQADAAAAFIAARFRNPSGMPSDYLPGLEETIWYGSPEAQRIAMNEIRRYIYPPAVLSSIDGAYENPILTRYVVNTLAAMNDPRARTFLTNLLLEGSDFYKGSGCKGCNDTGYSGRMGLYEILMMTSSLKDLINPSVSGVIIREQAVKEGFKSLFLDGIQKAGKGLTSLSEVFRVALAGNSGD